METLEFSDRTTPAGQLEDPGQEQSRALPSSAEQSGAVQNREGDQEKSDARRSKDISVRSIKRY